MRRNLRLTAAIAAGGITAAALPLIAGGFSDQSAFAAAFGNSNVVVYRVGNGSGALTNAATPVFLDEYQPNGTKQQSIALPTAANGEQHRLTASGLSTSEGQLVRSPNGRYLTATGYDAPVGALGAGGRSLTATSPTAVGRTVAVVDGNGVIDTSTSLTDSSAPYIVRSAVTLDGSRAWVAGGNGGARRIALGAGGSSSAVSAEANLSQLTIAGNQLFASTSDTAKLVKVGSGTPLAGAALDGIPGINPVSLPNGYVLLDETAANYAGTELDTLYLANGASGGGAVEKYRYTGSAWNKVGSIAVEGVLGLAAQTSGPAVAIIATTPSTLVGITDSNGAAESLSGSATTLATADSNTEFRGVALAPSAANGPSIFVRSPLADAPAVTGSSLSVTADAISSDSVSAVSVQVDSGAPAPATHGSADRWNATIPLTGVANGTHSVTVSATDATGTTNAVRTFSLDTAVPVTPPVTPPTTGPVANPNAIRVGTISATDARIARGGFKSTTYNKAPGRRGLLTKGKARASFQVFGGNLRLHFNARIDGGKVTVIVDGRARVIDLYSKKHKDLVVTFANLGAGNHSVQVVAAKKRSKKSKGFVVLIGYVQVSG